MSEQAADPRKTDRFDLRAIFETSQLLSSSLDLEFVLSNLLQLSNVSGEQDTTKIDKSRGVLRGIIEAVRQRSKPKETP